MTPKKKFKRFIKILLIIAFIIITINILQIPEIIECERLTKNYAHEFNNPKGYEGSHWRGTVQTVKVLEYNTQNARVLFITTHYDVFTHEVGRVVSFTKASNGNWKMEYDQLRWGGGGTLSKGVMPYWWYNFPMWILD